MSLTGFWFVGHASDETVARVRPVFDDLVARWGADEKTRDALDAWRAFPDQIHGDPGSGEVSPLTASFLEVFWNRRLPEDVFYACADPDLEDETWDLSEPLEHECRAAFAAIPNVAPAALLYGGLGPSRGDLIPGPYGLLALTGSEVVQHAEAIRHAHMLPPQHRFDAIARMEGLLHAVRAPGYPTIHLLEALPEVVGTALAAGTGLVAVSTVT